MKRLIAITLITAAVGLNLNALGQDMPWLTSKAAFRTYCEEQSAYVDANISTSLPGGNNTSAWVPVSEQSAAGIIATIKAMNLAVDVANPKDPLWTSGASFNTNGYVLLSGSSQSPYYLVNAGIEYVLPDGYGKFEMEMVDSPAIAIPGAEYATVYILDANGKTELSYSLEGTGNGQVPFPWRLTSTNFILSVYTNSATGGPGGWLFWNSGGKQIHPQHFNAPLSPTIKGTVTMTNTNVLVAVTTTKGVGTNITAELKVTTNQWSKVMFWTTEGKWFNGALVRKAGTSLWQPYPVGAFTDGSGVGFYLPAQAGIYYIIPTWNTGDLVEPADPWVPPYYGGGGVGMGTATSPTVTNIADRSEESATAQ